MINVNIIKMPIFFISMAFLVGYLAIKQNFTEYNTHIQHKTVFAGTAK